MLISDAIRLRSVEVSDAKQISDIYRPYVLETAICFEFDPPTPQEIETRILETTKKFPYLVAESDGQILGYAYGGVYRSRCAYQWTAETTVYIRQNHHRKGIGQALYRELLLQLQAREITNVIAGIALPNEASVRLHECLGFKHVGVFKNVGFKLGKAWDVGFWQLEFSSSAEIPNSGKAQSGQNHAANGNDFRR